MPGSSQVKPGHDAEFATRMVAISNVAWLHSTEGDRTSAFAVWFSPNVHTNFHLHHASA